MTRKQVKKKQTTRFVLLLSFKPRNVVLELKSLSIVAVILVNVTVTVRCQRLWLAGQLLARLGFHARSRGKPSVDWHDLLYLWII